MDSDKYWDDDVAPMEMETPNGEAEIDSGFGDIDIKEIWLCQNQQV